MRDNDFINAGIAWDIGQDLLPGNHSLQFKAGRDDGTIKSHVTVRDEQGRRVRSYDVATVGELRAALNAYLAEYRTELRGKAPILTATGVDTDTRVDDIMRWGLLDLELAFLYSDGWQGKAKRYPPLDWILRTATQLPEPALHVCGKQARRQVIDGEIDVSAFGRIQINGRVTPEEIDRWCAAFPDHTIILQYHHDQKDAHVLTPEHPNLAILVDASGGNGVLPESWPLLETSLPVGFAGGLNYHNMREQVRRIREVARPGWWVDLESGLRDEEWFSMELLRYTHQEFTRGNLDP